jgi:hypothetical protein
VAKNGAVLHEAIAQENLLAADDIRAGKNNAAIRINNLGRDRRFIGVRSICQQSHDEEAKKEYEYCYL